MEKKKESPTLKQFLDNGWEILSETAFSIILEKKTKKTYRVFWSKETDDVTMTIEIKDNKLFEVVRKGLKKKWGLK